MAQEIVAEEALLRLTRLCGINLITLYEVVAAVGDVRRFPSHPGPRATKRRSLRFLMLNSARRPGIVRLHFWGRRFCRRCASDASYDSVANAGSINETTTDKPLVIDSV